ncbi:hypothetical protein GGH12_001331 [Coemansia sp. RSA 1822]|nr:hypothetical protein LPJ76_003267 [Coemansia sp. RSA 638]KAJ2565536.1 hypothetical protein GGH12_001331 [Coemansia sp. RSA 1822]
MSTQPAAPPKTPTIRTRSSRAARVTTPQNRVAALVSSSSLRRVHFSPQNEEIPSGTTPQSSPTRARMRPQSRGILKRSAMDPHDGSTLSSDNDHNAERFGENALLDRLSSLPSSPNNAVTGSISAFPQRDMGAGENETGNVLAFEESLEEAIVGLQNADGGDGADTTAARIYNQLCGLIAKHSAMAAEKHDRVMDILDCVLRDITNRTSTRAAFLAAVKCLGCSLHIEQISAIAASSKRLCPLLEAMQEQVVQHYIADKVVCQASVWCVGIMRAPAAIQLMIPNLVDLCVTVLSRLESSATIQYECLTAIEALLRRSPGATRQVFRKWVFPVLGCIVSQVPGVRAKADGIIRHNMPWIAADAHGSDMDAPVKQFVASKLDRMLASASRLLARGDYVLVARIWGMIVTICARHCRSKINSMLKVIQECFNSSDPDVLIAALMQWRCLIYAFVLDSRIHTCKCVQLILSPIITILDTPSTVTAVRLACVQCWATLVYALGEEIGSHIDVIFKVTQSVGRHLDIQVLKVAIRVLAAVFNKLMLPSDKVAQFIVPRMVIGTTMLAAADGKSLSNTRGPFSSDVVYTGDHTEILCNYVVGIEANSPTIPVLVETAVKYIRVYIEAERGAKNGTNDYVPDHGSFASLCNAVVGAIRVLQSDSKDATMALPSRAQELAIALAEAYIDTWPTCDSCKSRGCTTCMSGYIESPHAVLFDAAYRELTVLLADCRMKHTVHISICSCFDSTNAECTASDRKLAEPCQFSYAFALVQMHVRSLVWQLVPSSHTLSGLKPDPANIVRRVQRAITYISLDTDSESVQIEGVLAVTTAIYHVLDNHPTDISSDTVCPAIGNIVRYVASYMRLLDDWPHAPLLLKTVMRIHGVMPGGHMFDDLLQIACRIAGIVTQQTYLESVFAITSGLNLESKLSTNRAFDLMFGIFQSYSGGLGESTGYIHYIAAVTAVVASILQEQVPGLCAPAKALLVRMRQFTEQSNEQPQAALLGVCLDFMQQVATAEKGWMELATIHQLCDLKVALSYIINVVGSMLQECTVDKDVVHSFEQSVHAIMREAVRVSELKTSAAGSLPWAFTASDAVDSEEQTTGDTLVSNEQRKRTHSPASSDDESEPTSKNTSRSPESQTAANGSSNSTPTLPRRSKRRKRSKRKARVSQGDEATQPAQKAETERRISGLLDQLETELQSVSACGLGPLLQTQSRIAGIQQRLCDAMQQQAHID